MPKSIVENKFKFEKKLLHFKKEEYVDFVLPKFDFLAVYTSTNRINFRHLTFSA